MIRILQYVNVLDRGGVESFLFNNLSHMNGKSVNFDFLLTRDGGEAYDGEMAAFGCGKQIVPVHSAGKLRRYFETFRKTYGFFAEGGYEIVHFHSNPPGIMATASVLAAWRAGVPIRILHSHGAGEEEKSFGFLRPLITRICRAINCACCNRFLAPTMLAAQYGFTRSAIRGNRFRMINNAVDTERFLLDESKRQALRAELSLEGKYVVGHVGRFSEVKNHAFMLSVFARLCERINNAVLLLVGGDVAREGSLRDSLKAQAAALGIKDKVIFYGESRDIPGILGAMDVFLFPSKSEALGIAAVEAQLSGLAVLAASDHIPREVDVTGNMRWLSLRDAPEAWSALLAEMAGKERACVDILSPEICAYDAANTAVELKRFYEDCIRGVSDTTAIRKEGSVNEKML